MISAIFAMAQGGVIGRDNSLPWSLPADWAYFKRTTLGKIIIMGRKTWDSIGKPLPGRRSIVLTRNLDWAAHGCEVCHSVDEVLALVADADAFIIGGAEIYSAFMPYCERLYVTVIDALISGDAYFPNPNLDGWKLISSIDGVMDEKNAHPYQFRIYERA